MKNNFLSFIVVSTIVFFASCANNGGNAAQQNINEKKCNQTTIEGAKTPCEIKADAENLVDKEVVIEGKVSHVCMRSGKKAFIVGADDTTYTMQVFTGGEIDTFPRELMYKKVAISGIVKVNKISKEKIEESEKRTLEQMPKDTTNKENCLKMESCHHVMNQYAEMKKWMEDNAKDYYPVYYIEGRKFLN